MAESDLALSPAEIPEKKKAALVDAESAETGVDAARAVGEMVVAGGYGFRHFDLDLIWRNAGGLPALPVLTAAAAAVAGCVLGPMIGGELAYQYPWIGLRFTLPLASAVVAVLIMRAVARAVAGHDPERLGEMVRGNLGLIARAVAVRFFLLLVEGVPRAMLARLFPIFWFGTFGFYAVTITMSLAFFWLHLHIWSELALGGASAPRALWDGFMRAVGNAFHLPGQLLHYPGTLAARLQGRSVPNLSAADLFVSMVVIYAAGALVGNFLSTVFQIGTWSTGALLLPAFVLHALLAALAQQGVLALGLGRWCFYDLADRHESVLAIEPAMEEVEG